MSSLILKLHEIKEVLPHDNADKLEIIPLDGWQCITQKGNFLPGDFGLYFQPDTLLSHDLAEELGVTPYLKKLGSNYPDREKWAGRVSVANLRSRKSFGFLAKPREDWLDHLDDLVSYLGIEKYDPPEVLTAGDAETPSIYFPRYTDIENIRNFMDTFSPEDDVIVTEKIHGTNSRLGYCPETNGEGWTYMAGSHGVRRKYSENSLYWMPYVRYPKLKDMIEYIHTKNDCGSVVVYGEIFGQGVQDLHYEAIQQKDFRVFDISVNGEYLDYSRVSEYCVDFAIPMVPILHLGKYDWELMQTLSEGNTNIGKGKNIREGVVIRPCKETRTLDGRVIRKLIGFQYLNRKGGSENH